MVVVGLPLSLDGTRGRAAPAAEAEAEALGSLLAPHGVAVELFDERLTTVTAHQALPPAGAGDGTSGRWSTRPAAAVMLEAWLDGAGRAAPTRREPASRIRGAAR